MDELLRARSGRDTSSCPLPDSPPLAACELGREPSGELCSLALGERGIAVTHLGELERDDSVENHRAVRGGRTFGRTRRDDESGDQGEAHRRHRASHRQNRTLTETVERVGVPCASSAGA